MYRSKSRKIKTKRGALNLPEVATSTANYQPRLQIRKALLQRKTSLQPQRRTSWLQHLSVIQALNFNSESNTQLPQTIAQPRTARLLAEARKVKRRKKRKKKM